METAKDVVKRLVDSGTSLMVKCAQVLTREEFFFQPTYGASMGWTLGHLSAFVDWSMSNIDKNETRRLDSETREFFRGGRAVSQSDMVSRFQNPSDLIGLYIETHQRAISLLDAFDIARWREPTPTGCRYPNLGAVWESIAYENFWHLGQVGTCVPRIRGTSLAIPVPRPFKLSFERSV